MVGGVWVGGVEGLRGEEGGGWVGVFVTYSVFGERVMHG